jgi:hypothetical protein
MVTRSKVHELAPCAVAAAHFLLSVTPERLGRFTMLRRSGSFLCSLSVAALSASCEPNLEIEVTTTADGGPGSLRSAIHAVLLNE